MHTNTAIIKMDWTAERALLKGIPATEATIEALARRLGDRYTVAAHGFPQRKIIRIRPRQSTPAITAQEAGVIADTIERYLLIPALHVFPPLTLWEDPRAVTTVAATA